MARRRKKACAYCGGENAATVDHVIPRALYPPSKERSRIQRITVPTCLVCNRAWTDDEAHFRNVLMIAGRPNEPVMELWQGKVRRSFTYGDGRRRLLDLIVQLREVDSPQGVQHWIYPGDDERVMRVIRKVIRGLSHHHGILTPVRDEQIWAGIQQYQVPPAFLEEMTPYHAESDIIQYRYGLTGDDPFLSSCWLLRFFERTPFFGIVFRSVEAMAQVEADTLEFNG